MGYRSDIKLITTQEGWAKLENAVKKAGGTEWITKDLPVTTYSDGKYVLAEWDDVKWYEDVDPEVQAFMAELKKLMKDQIPCQYIRVGEDDTDIDVRESGWIWDTEYEDMPGLRLVRKIALEAQVLPKKEKK